MTVATLRILFRNYQQLRSLYETEGIDEFDTPDGPVSLWDLDYLYRVGLPKRARTRQGPTAADLDDGVGAVAPVAAQQGRVT